MTSTNVLRDFSSHLTFRSCVECTATPVCNCASDETCVESSRTCTSCPTTSCLPSASTSTSTSSSGGGSNVGAIAGGVVGGLAIIVILSFLVWWFMARKRRQAQVTHQENVAGMSRHERSRSMQSIASTVLTRASNVIQIAYIPGVTNRSPPDTPGTLVPPVPPIPSTHVSTFSNDQYLFTPGDLRDSRFTTATSDRRSIATSLARSSVATTIYRNDAVVMPIPAQQARAFKPAMVSVKQANGASSDSLPLNIVEAPAMPPITEAQLQKAGKVKPQLSSIVARSVVARPVNVKGSKPKVPTVTEEADSDTTVSTASHSRAKRFTNQDSRFEDSSDEGSDDEVNEKASGKGGSTGISSADSIQIAIANEGPFADIHSASTPTTIAPSVTVNSSTPSAVSSSRASSRTSTHRQRTSIGSSRMLENTMVHELSAERSPSPFDDKHAVQ